MTTPPETAVAIAERLHRKDDAAPASACSLLIANEASAIAALHAQAASVINVKALMPVTLDRVSNNYSKWRDMFLVVLGKYELTDHVICDDAKPDQPAWVRMEKTFLHWIFNTVAPDLMERVMIHDTVTRTAWLSLDEQFLGNKESRALILEVEFCNFVQGSLSITDYASKLQTMAAALADFDDPISPRQLVLSLLRGLNEQYAHLVSPMKMQRPFPILIKHVPHCSWKKLVSRRKRCSLQLSWQLVGRALLAPPVPSGEPSTQTPPGAPRHPGGNCHRRRGNGCMGHQGGQGSGCRSVSALLHVGESLARHRPSLATRTAIDSSSCHEHATVPTYVPANENSSTCLRRILWWL